MLNKDEINIIIDEIPPKIPKHEWVGVDIEMFNMDKHLMHLPITGEFASLQVARENGDVYVITDEKKVKPTIQKIKSCMWVGQNFQFDIVQLRRWANIPDRELLWDTMYIEKIIWGGYFDNAALDDLVRRYLNIHMDKTVRKEFVKQTELTREMIEYGAWDAYLTLMVAAKQRKFMTKDWYENIWMDVDLPATNALVSSMPFRIDKTAWFELAETHERKQKEIDDQLNFNPRSWQQVQRVLNASGFKDVPSTGDAVLEKYIKKYPKTRAALFAQQIRDSRKYGKRASTYGKKFIDKYIIPEKDYWVVKPDYFTIGAETGRTSCRKPNLQNIPSRDTMVFRDCFIARPGNKLVVLDYSAQEPRIGAFLSGDKAFIDVMNSGKDIYIESTRHIYSTEEEGMKNRNKSKAIILGLTYGKTAYGLAQDLGITKGAAEEFITQFFQPYPRLRQFLNDLASQKRYVETVIGRRVWLNPYSSQCSRNAQNSPHQGSAADMTKLAIVNLRKGWNSAWTTPGTLGDWGLVQEVHDETGFDVPEDYAKAVESWAGRIMVETAEKMCPGVKFKVGSTICDKWSEAK